MSGTRNFKNCVDVSHCRIYQGIQLLSTTYKTECNILVPVLTPYGDKIIVDYQCRF